MDFKQQAYDFLYWIMPYLTMAGGVGLGLYYLLTDHPSFASLCLVPVMAGIGWILEDRHDGIR